jgi:potassium-transporting ATPase KdpC subunit
MKQIRISLTLLVFMTVLLGLVYPLAMTGGALLLFPEKSKGSLITAEGGTIGSGLIGQNFYSPIYFHGRPSANNYDGTASGGSNLGPTNRKLIDLAMKNIAQVRKENGLPPDAKIPSDLALASASGLDPHISLDAAIIQAGRIAGARGIEKQVVDDLIVQNRERPYWGMFGNPYVNVLKLNMALNARGVKNER